jgi:formylglycine-generating enzyme required for sulfatase activity
MSRSRVFRNASTWCLALCLVMMAIPVNAKRLALVMGNDNYISVSKLQKAGNDADAMARELKAAGFAVTLHKDLNYRRMVKAIDAFIESITGGDEVVVFYAGHGVQIKTGAHLLPVDIEAESESQIEKTAYGLNDLTEKLSEAKPAFTLVMVDACRDNPMKAKGRAVGNARGLNALEPPKGQIVVYSASRGQQALDRLSDNDSNPNGVFTREFITRMRTPGVRIEDMIREVQDSVESLAKSVRHEQRPAVYNEARGNFYFYGPTTVQIQQGGDDSEVQTWAAAQAANSVAAFQTYLDLFPKGRYAGPAKIKLDAIKQRLEKPSTDAEIDLWAEVKTTGTREYLEAYLKQYPSGRYVALAHMELKKLDDVEETKNAKLALEVQQAKQREEQQAQRIEQTVWDQARTADTVASYTTYLEKYPSGRFTSQAKAAKLAAETLLAVAEQSKKARLEAEARWVAREQVASINPEMLAVAEQSEKARLEAEARWVAREQVASINPEMVVIPAGTFVMGSNNSPLEQPTHSVAVRSFLMGKTEVTQELWMSVMGINPSQNKGRTLPVDRVSWDDVEQFIAKLNQKTGQKYRLPSEAEWEYAARAGTTTDWSHGNDESKLINYAWYDGNSGRKTQEVGQKLPNAFGLYDMHGNVLEWTQDCWHKTYAGAPTDGSAWTTGCNGNVRVLRGGSWIDYPAFLRSAFRLRSNPVDRNYGNGFRLARTP